MKPRDWRVLCTALGFTAVVMQGGRMSKTEGGLRATKFAGLIEEFCRVSLPEAFAEKGEEKVLVVDLESSNPEGRFAFAGRMATAIVEIMREKGGCLPHDLAAKGFTYEEIDRHWPMAKALAAVELKMTDA